MNRPAYLVLARVDGLLLGFDVRDVREVLGDDTVLPVPLTPPMVRGLINLRGEVVTVIDARTMLRSPARVGGERPIHLVVQHKREFLSLEVDEVLEVAAIAPRQYAGRPDGLHDAVRKLACAIVQREKDLVLVVDVEQLFDQLGAREDRKEDACARS